MNEKDQVLQIKALLVDADGVIQYATEDWAIAFARCLERGDPALESRFTADIYAAESACLTRADGFDQALQGVLTRWDCADRRAAVLQAMLSIHRYHEVQGMIRAVRARGIKCYVASNQQAQRAAYMSAELGYAAMFDGELYSCALGAAKPSECYFELALEAIDGKAATTLFIDDREENVAGAKRAGLHAFVYDGRQGVDVLRDHLHNFGIKI